MSTGCQKDRQRQQDVKKTETQAYRQTDRNTDRRQKDFSAQLSKQKLFRMSTACQKTKNADRHEELQAGQLKRKEPALVYYDIPLLLA